VVAFAFGADFGFGGSDSRSGWSEPSGLGAILPWGNSKARRKVTPLQDARLRLSDERKRRVESEKSPSPSADSPGRIARLEFIRATALIAMGNESDAARSLERLLEVVPDFDLDEANSSPKLVRALARLRAGRV
jgi:hypothetical protein